MSVYVLRHLRAVGIRNLALKNCINRQAGSTAVRHSSSAPANSINGAGHGALKGLKVLDMSRVLAVSTIEQFLWASLMLEGTILYTNTRRLWRRCNQDRAAWFRSMYFKLTGQSQADRL